jgi:hypothetical protein
MDRDGIVFPPLPPDVGSGFLDRAYKAIPESVISIRDFWMPYRVAHAAAQDAIGGRKPTAR